jgi:F-type H+-transporting ATPase subunit a
VDPQRAERDHEVRRVTVGEDAVVAAVARRRRVAGLPVWLWGAIGLLVLVGLFVIPGGAKQELEIAGEFKLRPLVHLPKVGPFDLSITKAVVYLWIATAVIVVIALVIARNLREHPSRFQYAMEALYELAHDGIAASVMKSGVSTWFPYVGAVFFFVLVNNLVGLIPLPFGEHHQLSFYAATANLNVTITLALFTFAFTHYAGIRKHGTVTYIRTWMPKGAPPVLREFIFLIHIVSELFRLVSLSVRLFANMVAGHAILAVFFAMALIFQSYLAAVVLQGGSVVIFLFEIFVAAIQAFIFAILSAVYIGGALEEGH